MTVHPEETKAERMLAIRAAVLEAIGDESDYNVILTALGHATGSVLFSYLFLKDGGLNDENVKEAIVKYTETLQSSATKAMGVLAAEAAQISQV